MLSASGPIRKVCVCVCGGGGDLVSYPDPNVRKHYRLQYNTAYIGSGQQVVLGM